MNLASPSASLSIQPSLRNSKLLESIGKKVTVQGFYYSGSIPMIVDDMERIEINLPLPKESYIPIVGQKPAGLKWGDYVSVTGILRKPKPTDPRFVHQESVIIELEKMGKVEFGAREKIKFTDRTYDANKLASSAIVKRIQKIGKAASDLPEKHAVLIAGGGSPDSNHIRYWNDLVTMYSILRANGYPAENITVIYADGLEPTNVDGKIEGSMPVNFSATRENIRRTFDELARSMTSNDSLFIMTNDHGGGCLTTVSGSLSPAVYGGSEDTSGDESADNISEAAIGYDLNRDGDKNDRLFIDETLSLWQTRALTDDELANEINKIRNYKQIIVIAEQCFSGGMLQDLNGPNRVLISAARDVQISRARRPGLLFNEFSFWFMAALSGEKPDGTGKVKADIDGNGKVSIAEAFNFAAMNDNTDETPCYEDNNHFSWVNAPIPKNGEGELGLKTYL
jgi:hypothetical protein